MSINIDLAPAQAEADLDPWSERDGISAAARSLPRSGARRTRVSSTMC